MIANWSRRLIEKLQNRKYRAAYVDENVRTGIAYQVRALRGDLSQSGFGRKIKKPQSVVSRLEDPDYGKLSIQTLLEIASALDVALLVKFVSFPEFIRQTRDVSPENLTVPSYNPNTFAIGNVFNAITPQFGVPQQYEVPMHRDLNNYQANAPTRGCMTSQSIPKALDRKAARRE